MRQTDVKQLPVQSKRLQLAVRFWYRKRIGKRMPNAAAMEVKEPEKGGVTL
jgi:hypothetical protein